MPAITRASIQNLKSRIDIVDVVSTVVALKKAGADFKGLSPFNTERTPSFFVSPAKGLYKCFSSGKAGDVISFVMETERLGFTESVETLARRFNIPLEYEAGGPTAQERSLRQELFELHETAAGYFRTAFLESNRNGEFIRDYWTNHRRFSLDTADDFQIGVVAPDGGRLAETLRKRGHSDEALRECGLFYVRSGGGLSPRFRGRLMIPIRDQQGRIVAFTARQTEITPTDDPTREAKYVNSPETPIFVKGQLLFNLDRARRHAAKDKPFLMVEGQLDAIRCWSAGLDTVIAPQGTGVTETQLRLLRRFHAGIECLLDGDRAGQGAALRLLPLALQEGLEISFLPLSGKVDPDQLVLQEGAEGIVRLRERRLGVVAFAASALLPDPATASAQERAEACREIFALIARNPSQVAQSEYIAELSTRAAISRSALESDYRLFLESNERRRQARSEYLAARPEDGPTSEQPPTRLDPIGIAAATDLLMLVLHYESLGPPLAHTLDHAWIDTSSRAGRLLDQFLNDFAHDLWPGVDQIEQHLDDPEDRTFIAGLLFATPAIDDPVKVVNDGIRRMVSDFCIPKIRKIELEIAAKQRNFDSDLISLLKTADELRRLRLNPPTIRPPA
jgi:DNA primase